MKPTGRSFGKMHVSGIRRKKERMIGNERDTVVRVYGICGGSGGDGVAKRYTWGSVVTMPNGSRRLLIRNTRTGYWEVYTSDGRRIAATALSPEKWESMHAKNCVKGPRVAEEKAAQR